MKRTIAHSLKKENADCVAVSESTGNDMRETFGDRYDWKIKVVYGAGCDGIFSYGSP